MDKENRKRLKNEYRRQELEKTINHPETDEVIRDLALIELGKLGPSLSLDELHEFSDLEIEQKIYYRIIAFLNVIYTKDPKGYRGDAQELNGLSPELRMIYYTFEFEGLAAMDKLYYELFEHRDVQRITGIKLAYKVLGFPPMTELFDKFLLCEHEEQVDELTQVFQDFAPKFGRVI